MTEEVERIVRDAIAKCKMMRAEQRAYFILRTREKLNAAKAAERVADDAIYEAEYALKYGVAKPRQEELPL